MPQHGSSFNHGDWRARALLLTAFGALTIIAGCRFDPNANGGQSGTGGIQMGIAGLTALRIDPVSAEVAVTKGGPAQTKQYKAIGTVNGHERDVSGEINWSVDRPEIATVKPGGLVSTTGVAGGIVAVSAVNGNAVGAAHATASLLVRFSFDGADPGMADMVPKDAPSKFSGADDPNRAPELVYPNDGVLFPPNVSGIEVHFRTGANNKLFQVSFVSGVSSIKSYVRCTKPADAKLADNECIYQPDRGLWEGVAQTNAGQGPVALTVRGTDDQGSGVGASATFTLQFAKDPLKGALYYWTTSGSAASNVKGAILRWNFGDPSQTKAERYVGGEQGDGKTCIGCHALSHDGTKLVASAGGQSDARVLLFDLTTKTALAPFPLAERTQFESWNPDGTQYVGIGRANGYTGAENLRLFDGNSGMLKGTIDLGGLRADHPDWSRDGATIAFTSVDTTASYTDQRPGMGGISFVQVAAGAWGAPKVLVAPEAGKNRYYPAIAPDSDTVVFNESTCPTGKTYDKNCNGDTDPSATLFVTHLSGGAPVPLAAANSPGVADAKQTDLTNTYAKWAPFEQYLDEQHTLMWLTVSSARRYGLRTPPAGESENPVGTLIWMAGVNKSSTQDPSYAAFCLPFQDISTSNHIAQWADFYVPAPG